MRMPKLTVAALLASLSVSSAVSQVQITPGAYANVADEEVEARVIEIVRAMAPDLTDDAVDLDRPMAELGLDSLARMEVVLYVEEAFGTSGALQHFRYIGNPTIRQIADWVRQHRR